MQYSIITTLPLAEPAVTTPAQVLVRVYLGEPGWPNGTVEVDHRGPGQTVWTPITLAGGEAEVRNEGDSQGSLWRFHDVATEGKASAYLVCLAMWDDADGYIHYCRRPEGHAGIHSDKEVS